MIIKSLHIKNFRCFQDFHISFGETATVIFGKNGSGKTSLMNALHKALSFIMTSDRVYTKDKSSGKKKLVEARTITSNNPYLYVEGFSKGGDYNNTDDPEIEIEATATLDGVNDLKWCMSAYTTNSKLRPSGYIRAFRRFYEWHIETGRLPVLAFYSDCFPHKEDNKRPVKKNKISDLVNFGYFDWNAVEGCSKIWIGRLVLDIVNIRQAKDKLQKLKSSSNDSIEKNSKLIDSIVSNIAIWQHEVDTIERCLVEFSKSMTISDDDSMEIAAIDLYSGSLNLCVNTIGGSEILFANLPSGYKRLFNIVLDLAFRSYILSGKESTNIPGIALIDEVDLHLHPELENVALVKLMQTFPQIQFIVSTHSINVLTSISTYSHKSRILMMLKGEEEPEEFIDIFGLDPNTGQQEIMGVRLNGEDLERLLEQCAYMKSIGLFEQSQNLMKFIAEKAQISQVEIERRIGLKLEMMSNATHQ